MSIDAAEATTMTAHPSTINVRSLPVVVDLPTAARLLGIGRSSAYELVRTGQWPTPVIRVGRLIRVPTARCWPSSAPPTAADTPLSAVPHLAAKAAPHVPFVPHRVAACQPVHGPTTVKRSKALPDRSRKAPVTCTSSVAGAV